MNFDDALTSAAHKAAAATNEVMEEYKSQRATDEDDLTGVLHGLLHGALVGQIDGLRWSASILRHRKGGAAEEKRLGVVAP